MGKILIVEDEFIIATDLRNIITDLGYEVLGIAKSAQEAISILEEKEVDLALLDIRILGNINGLALGNILERQYEVAYMYITSYADSVTKENINKSQALGCILKPFEKQDIGNALSSLTVV